MDDQCKVLLIGGADGEQALFTLSDENDDCRLQCAYRGKVMESVAPDYFQALCDVRSRLSGEGLIPFCYGASMNVYPSSMARNMGQGLKAYKLTRGERAVSANLVDIFAEGPDIVPASVERQIEFFEDWAASLQP